jgi:uncharacterized membrane protein (UPF0182 family)
LYADFRWYDALDAGTVWQLRFGEAFLLRVLAFSVGTTIAFANLWAVRHSVVSLVMPRKLGNIEIGEEVSPRTLMSVVVTLAVILGALFSIPASDWQGFTLARTGVPFDETDPYFNADIGFFVYWLPFERGAYVWTLAVTAIVIAIVVTLYALTPSLRWERSRLHVTAYVRRHIALLGGASLALLAWSFRLDAYGALTDGSGPNGAFAAVDDKLGIPISIFLSYATIAASFVVSWAGWTGQSRVAVTVLLSVLLLTPTMRYALPVAVRWGSAPVDPIVRERPYESVRASFTRRAFAVDQIRVLPPSEALSSVADAATVGVWDPAALEAAVERTRRRAPIAGPPAVVSSAGGPVLLSVESPARDDGPPSAGWTLVRTLAAVTDARGAIVRVDEQGQFPLDDQRLGAVHVFAGARGHVIVRDSVGGVAAPSIRSFGARLSEAWSQQNFRLLSDLGSGARIVRRRDVRERIAAIAPFFEVGSTVFPLVHNDSLYWVSELYSASRDYPLARRLAGEEADVNYWQAAATAVVHASSGRVAILPVADPDPIARTWLRHLSALSRATAPRTMLAMLPPRVDGAELQAEAFAAVGLRGEGGTRRHIPSLDGGDTVVASATPTFVWLPSQRVSAWSIPIVDGRDRIAGVLLATGGAQKSLRWFPAPDTATTWGELLDRLARTETDAESRSPIPRAAGRVRILPLASGSLLAMQPFYGWPSDGPPFVSRVAVLFRDTVRATASAAAAVGAPVPYGPAPASPDAERERLRSLYADMRAALMRGDWIAFGAAFEALGAMLERR